MAYEYLFLRSALVIALAGSGYLPIIHTVLFVGIDGLRTFPLINTIITCTLYLLGAGVYVTRVPEKYWSGKFDIWVGSSPARLLGFLLPKCLSESNAERAIRLAAGNKRLCLGLEAD
jgi:hypothetical protein